MKLNVGDYVRTKQGRIGKISNLTVDYSSELILCEESSIPFAKHQIIKSSPKIIDLIEAGDYVNGYLIDYINLGCETPFLRSNRPYRVDNTLYSTLKEKGKDYNQPLHFYNEDIKSVLTHEQMEQMQYMVGEE